MAFTIIASCDPPCLIYSHCSLPPICSYVGSPLRSGVSGLVVALSVTGVVVTITVLGTLVAAVIVAKRRRRMKGAEQEDVLMDTL